MSYSILLIIHLLAAFVFIGTVFFEIIFLSKLHQRIPHDIMRLVEREIGTRARQVIPWVLLILFSAGISMAWFHRAALNPPWGNSFGTLLSIKILLAISVFCHFILAMTLRKKGKLKGKVFHRIHVSVFCHVIIIVILAKAMFHFTW